MRIITFVMTAFAMGYAVVRTQFTSFEHRL